VKLPARTAFVATLSKALGSQGGFAASSAEVIDVLVNRARSFIYSTGLAPVCAAGALAAVKLLEDPRGRERLRWLSLEARRRLSSAFPNVPEGETPIIPLVVGEVGRAAALSRKLLDAGIFAPAIRPPTVPKGTARLRISLCAEHTSADVERLAEALRS
jgi:7-keto-8-aminopelargonate synthetase-like enzyme